MKAVIAILILASAQAFAADPTKAWKTCEIVGTFDIDTDGIVENVCLPTKDTGARKGWLLVDGEIVNVSVPAWFQPVNLADVNGDGILDIAGYRKCPTCNWQTFDAIPGWINCDSNHPYHDFTNGVYPDGNVGEWLWAKGLESITIEKPNGQRFLKNASTAGTYLNCSDYHCRFTDPAWLDLDVGVTRYYVGARDDNGDELWQCVYYGG